MSTKGRPLQGIKFAVFSQSTTPLIVSPPRSTHKKPCQGKAKEQGKAKQEKQTGKARQGKARQGKKRCTDAKARVRMLCHDSETKSNEIDRDSYTRAHESMPKSNEIDKESYTGAHESMPKKTKLIRRRTPGPTILHTGFLL